MGEMADWVLDQYDPDGPLYDYGGLITCRYCGTEDLHWENVGTKSRPQYRLADESCLIHQCPQYPGDTND